MRTVDVLRLADPFEEIPSFVLLLSAPSVFPALANEATGGQFSSEPCVRQKKRG